MALEGLQNGRYRRLRLLGGGSMGEVYLMEDARINRHVAIKVIRSEASADSDAARDAARLFQREARAIAALEHPNILPLYDFGEEDLHGTTLTYMVMPFCLEGSFADWLRQRGNSPLLSPQDVPYFVDQAAEALQYAHDHQTLHLDVKPSNFLIRTNTKRPGRPTLLLADFGVARLSATISSSSRTVRGTPIAMAPEQWSGSPVPATDQYALAVMTYQLLVGRPPFLGGLEQLMYQHFNAQPQPPSTLNPRLSGAMDTVIGCALAKRPEQRFASVSAFVNAIRQAVQMLPTGSAVRLQQPDDSDIRATLAISKAEALKGTSRTLTLPWGQFVTVAVPQGAYDGQVIRLQNLDELSRGVGPAGALILTIAIQQTEEAVLAGSASSAEPTYQSASVPASTPELLEPLIPPPSSGLLPPTVAAETPATQEPTVFDPPPPPSNQGVPALPSTSRGIMPSRSLLPKGKMILLVGLALLLIASGIGLFSLVHANQVATNNANATTTANANQVATNNANATATSGAFDATLTAAANGQTATPTALQNLYNQTTSRTPTLSDPLHDNSKGYGWNEGANGSGGNCAFVGGVYHVSQSNTKYLNDCFGPYFSNFVFEVQMKITKGGAGGITFRADSTSSTQYVFSVGQDGSYQLYVYGTAPSTGNSLRSGTSSAIKQGLNQTSLIAVIAQGSTIALYVNHQLLDYVDDSTYSSGQIGFVADPINIPTEVLYSNAKVWTL